MSKIILYALSIVVISASSIYVDRKVTRTEPEIKIVEKTKIEYRDVIRNYTKYNKPELIEELLKYDKGTPSLEGEIKDNAIHVEAGLNKRKWSRDFKLGAEVYSGRNWKCYFIVGGVVAAGALYWKFRR